MMFNLIRVPIIRKTPGQSLQDMGALFNFPQQQSTTVRTDLATVKFTHHHTASKTVEFQLTCITTLCLHKAVFLLRISILIAQVLCHEKQPFSILPVRNAG